MKNSFRFCSCTEIKWLLKMFRKISREDTFGQRDKYEEFKNVNECVLKRKEECIMKR